MPPRIPGIHHITAVASSPQRNVEFYTGVLGLRLVKQTVNFDDPYTYHLYYGDEVGHPGTILTFFPWPDAGPGRIGRGQVTTIAFAIPEASVRYWKARLSDHGVDVQETMRMGEPVLRFRDPDGLQLELVAPSSVGHVDPWTSGPIPARHAIRGFYGATLTVAAAKRTADLLETMGFEFVDEVTRQRFRYRSTATLGSIIDIESRPNARPGVVSVGTVHHIAFRTPRDETQVAWRTELVERGLNVTPVIDRQYFRSIYFREPAGILFEIATDLPGFTVDEEVENLGTTLTLPPWLEPRREQIAARLPEL